MVVNLSGRGDKDLETVARHLESKARDDLPLSFREPRAARSADP